MGTPHQLFVGRQGIFTATGALHGHEFLYRAGHAHTLKVDRWSTQAQDRATLKVLEATFTSCGLFALVADAPLALDALVFVNFTRAFLVDDLPIPPLPSHLVIEVVESVRADADVIAGVARLREAGFRIALDDFVGLDSQRALLPYADYVKIDTRDLRERGADLLALAASHGATLVAERIETAECWEACRAQGFELFQGNLMEAATVIEHAASPAGRWPAARHEVPTQSPGPVVEIATELLALPALTVAVAVPGWPRADSLPALLSAR